MSENYQGYENRETWAMALHLNNTQWLQEQTITVINTAKNNSEFSFEVCDSIKNYIEELFENFFKFAMKENRTDYMINYDYWNTVKLMLQDVGSLWRVNWREIVESLTEE